MLTRISSSVVAAVLGAAVAMATAVVLPGRADDAPHAVTVDNFTFNPQRLTIKAGNTVTWTNKDDIPHAIASVGALFRTTMHSPSPRRERTNTSAPCIRT
jgi:plastocyanin